MVDSYKKTLTYYWLNHSTGESKTVHRVIAALICRNGDTCYTAILSTGTYYNDSEKCGSTSTCDGHAVSICYEAAPKYFLKEIGSLHNGGHSIFEYLPNAEGYRLKDGVSFHLLVTEFPCGFIRDRKDSCMEWKVPFVEFPHVSTCSSRILIGATMGIQGYISHLLDKPIMVDSLVILCTDIDKTQVFDYCNSFSVPRVIKTMKYDPKDFWPGSFIPLSSSSNKSFTKHESHESPSYESADRNETAASDGPVSERPDHSSVIVTTPEMGQNLTFLKFDPRSARERSSHVGCSMKSRDIDPSFEVNEELRVQRISYLKQLYSHLVNCLNLEEALEMLKARLSTESKSKEEAVSLLIKSISTELTGVHNALGTNTISEQQWDSHIQKQVENRLHDMREEGRIKIRNQNMVECIKTILTKETDNIIMDCIWHQYLHALPSSFQPSDE